MIEEFRDLMILYEQQSDLMQAAIFASVFGVLWLILIFLSTKGKG